MEDLKMVHSKRFERNNRFIFAIGTVYSLLLTVLLFLNKTYLEFGILAAGIAVSAILFAACQKLQKETIFPFIYLSIIYLINAYFIFIYKAGISSMIVLFLYMIFSAIHQKKSIY